MDSSVSSIDTHAFVFDIIFSGRSVCVREDVFNGNQNNALMGNGLVIHNVYRFVCNMSRVMINGKISRNIRINQSRLKVGTPSILRLERFYS